MIDCSEEYIWYKKRRVKAPKRLFAFFLVFIIVVSVCLFYKFVVSEKIFKICVDYARSYCTMSVNESVLLNLSDGVQYSDLISIEKNNNGDIIMMSANSYKVNLLSRKIVEKTQEELDKKLKEGIPVPILAFLGIDMISGYGKTIKHKSLFVSTVQCGFNSEFQSVGINQTLHSIYVTITTTVKMQTGFIERFEEIVTPVLISETVLVGAVPEIYLNGKLFS